MNELIRDLEERLADPTAKGLADTVTQAIRDGLLDELDPLPPIRMIARELCLSPTTVSAAWRILQRAGLIHSDGRRGTRVTSTRVIGPPRYRRALLNQTSFNMDLSNGIPDPLLLPDLPAALQNIGTAASPDGYLNEHVLPELIIQLRKDWPYQPSNFTIVDGAMDGFDLVARSIVRHGDRVVVEDPTFPPVLDLLEALGATIVPVTYEPDGLDTAALARALQQPATLLFLQPRGQNPTGLGTTRKKMLQIATIIRKANVIVFEDDAAGSIAQQHPVSLGSYAPEQVIHARSFSKSHGTELRLAAISASREIVDQIDAMRQFGQSWTSRILQTVLFNFLTDETAINMIHQARDEYARRSQLMRAELKRYDITTHAADGINLWVPVFDEAAAIMRLAAEGIAVAPGSPFRVRHCKQHYIRISLGKLRTQFEEVAQQIGNAAHTKGWRINYRPV